MTEHPNDPPEPGVDPEADAPALASEEVPWTAETLPGDEGTPEPAEHSADLVDPQYERDDLGGA